MLLADGGVAHLRPIRPSDADRLVAFYERVSPESKYLRFFVPYPRLSDRDVERFTEVDYVDRVAFILTLGQNMIAVGRSRASSISRVSPRRYQGRRANSS